MKPLSRNQSLASLRAFLGDSSDIVKVIELCHLYPMESWKKWTDHLGNYIQVKKSKKSISTEHNPETYAPIVTDILYKSHPKTIAALSNKAFISFGHDNEIKNSVCFIWFLGYDERLRLVANYNNKWIKNAAPLTCGIDTLAPIVSNLTSLDSSNSFVISDILHIRGPIAAKIVKSWAINWPPSQELLHKLKKHNISEIICDLANLELKEI